MATDDDAEDEARRHILARASAASGIDFRGYRHAVMVRRVQHRATATACGSLAEYLRHLDADADEVHRLTDALLIKTTELFREVRTLDLLRAMLPAVLQHRIAHGDKHVRAWVAGCSTGEEAFSIACVLLAAVERLPRPMRVRVYGTDADPRALERAKSGVIATKLGAPSIPAWAQRWFSPTADGLEVGPEIRDVVTFSCHDLLDEVQPAPAEAVLASFDVVSCRNVLIYLEEPHRRRVLCRLASAVEAAGVLLLGDAEATPPEASTHLVRPDASAPLYTRRA
jgi:chemotaxis methyl-accepting protein methylase